MVQGPVAADPTKAAHAPYVGATTYEVKYAAIACSSSGDNTIVAAVTSRKLRVLSYLLNGSAAVNAKWRSAANDKTGLLYMGAAGYGAVGNYNPSGWFETNAGEALNLNLSGAVPVGGHLSYVEV